MTGASWIEMGSPHLTIDPWRITWGWQADRTLTITHMAWDTPGGLKIGEITRVDVVSGDTFTFNVGLK